MEHKPTLRVVILVLCGLMLASAPGADPTTESAYRKVLLADEYALEQVDQLISSNEAFKRQGAGLNDAMINTKVRSLTDPVREKYDAFLKQHPKHVKGHLAYASFLGQFGLTDTAKPHLEEALRLAPNDPVALNNAANYYGANGPARKAFELLEKAISLKPNEATYRRNFASVLLTHRQAARAYLGVSTEQEIFARVSLHYRQALKLAPEDFLLATDFAQIHYQLRPFPYTNAVNAWEGAFNLAPSRLEKEGIMIHLARIHIQAKEYSEARRNLNGISRPEFQETKSKLLSNLPMAMKKIEFSTSTKPAPKFNLSTQPPPRNR
ncbi:MAG: hypothetical protein ACPGVU_20775 [Limisphaerales bacterium]